MTLEWRLEEVERRVGYGCVYGIRADAGRTPRRGEGRVRSVFVCVVACFSGYSLGVHYAGCVVFLHHFVHHPRPQRYARSPRVWPASLRPPRQHSDVYCGPVGAQWVDTGGAVNA